MSSRRKTKRDMLATGLSLLPQKGIDRLTIDGLCRKLGVTKGAFYHHFASRRAYQKALLEYWMEENTERKKALADQSGTVMERYTRILEYAATLPHDQEKAIRAWAMHDPLVAEYQERVDDSRIDYLTELLALLLPDPSQASLMARLVLSAMIGSRHLYPAIAGRSRQELLGLLHNLMGINLPFDNSTKGDWK